MNIENKESQLKVVLDTNVYISILNFPDKPLFQIWQQSVNRKYKLLISPAIIKEIAAILREVFKWEEQKIIHQLKLLIRVGDIIIPEISINAVKNDPADNKILECAVAGKADLIVSGDSHLHNLKYYQEMPIIRPVDFLRILGRVD